MSLNDRGWEELDNTPIAKPLRWDFPQNTLAAIRASLDQRVALLSREAMERGDETLEESQDFDVGDDVEPLSLHELRSFAADMQPEELYEAVFRKPYQPPASVVPGTPSSGVFPGSSGDNPSVVNPSVPSSTGKP